MPNNLNALPSSGAISLQDIADAFYLYLPYSDSNTVALELYYGDLIKFFSAPSNTGKKYYLPTTPALQTTSNKNLNITPFHGKRFSIPIDLTINSDATTYNVYDQAAALAQSTYGLNLNLPGIPFYITVTNNATVRGATTKAVAVNTSTANYTTPGNYTWIAPTGVTSVNLVIVGGGGGGGGGLDNGVNVAGGGGGGGAEVVVSNNVSVTPNQSYTVKVGDGGPGAVSNSANGSIGQNSFFASTIAGPGGGGYAASSNTGGTGGSAGGTGGTAGGRGSVRPLNWIGNEGGIGGISLATPYGVGGLGGDSTEFNSAAMKGKSGAVFITYATTGTTSERNTQNTAAMIIGASSDGSRTFNQYTTIQLNNNGKIVGLTDSSTPYSSKTRTGSFTVPEGVSGISFTVTGGGGGGGAGGPNDDGWTKGGNGVSGHTSGAGYMPVNPGDTVSYAGGDRGAGGQGTGDKGRPGTAGQIKRNGTVYAEAGGGAGGGAGVKGGSPSPNGDPKNYVGGGGVGGHRGTWNDGGAGYGGLGGLGSASISYTPDVPGSPGIYITSPVAITNNGTIAGGTSSTGTVGAGYAIIGNGCVTSMGGTGVIQGSKI